ncbi:unnamed protein product [Auanema sp. JU1783]|nr:unnamed protein product [Auanema sp. JU1783]
MKTNERNEMIVSIPSNGVPLPECPFCDLRRCHPLPFCYTLKNGLRGNTIGEYCGTKWQLASLVRDQLANRITNDACQPSTTEPELAYCWCQNTTVSETVEDDLRRVRIWRYQSLKWSSETKQQTSFKLLPITSLLFSIYTHLY